MTRKRRPTTINYLSVAALMRALLDGPATVKDLAHESGLSMCTCRRYIRALHKAGVIHIKLWDVDAYGRRSMASYALGDKTDAPRNPKSSAEREAARRERLRQKNRTRRMNGIVQASATA
ncbi:MAG: winged helix-turn-helix domain-containing protein [Betaproteobacteria bacterium]|nr:winged helix-turn-helix domain-containing protein [Betaproteobacteria bacterium]